MWKEIAYAFRTLRKSPVFTAVAIASLALGIGANTAIFSLLDQALLRSLPVKSPDELVLLHTEYQAPGMATADNFESVFSYPMYRDLRDRVPVFAGVIARAGAGISVSWRGDVQRASGQLVSGNFFDVLGVGAAAGRLFTAADDRVAGGHPVAVLGYPYWSSRFGRNPGVLNQTITVNGHPFVIIGVVESRFNGLMRGGDAPEVYVPISMQRALRPTLDMLEDRQIRWLNICARLKPGVSLARAQGATDVVYRTVLAGELAAMTRMRAARNRQEFLNHRAELRPAARGINDLEREWGTPLHVLMAMVGLVLLIACANVAGLMMARAAGRQREIAIRLAMGAGRWALIRQLLLEGAVLAVAGGAAGLVVALWSTDGLLRLLPADYAGPWLVATIDMRMLAFTLVLSLLSAPLLALMPALRVSRPDPATVLKTQAASVASGGFTRFRKIMVAAQVALSLLLVAGAGLFTTSLLNLTRVELGFRTGRLLTFSVDATQTRPEPVQAVSFYRDLLRRFQAIPGVTGVGAADGGPFSGHNSSGNLTIEGYQAKPQEYVGSRMVAIGPGFFQALGVPVRAGREFQDRDEAGSPKVVVVNEAFARKYFAGRDPVGRRLMFGGREPVTLDREIVGVVADVKSEVRKPAVETVFLPFPQWARAERLTFYARTTADDARAAADVRRAVRAADANVPVGDLKPMDVLIRESITSDRLIALLSIAFGLLATVLAAVGLYGVVAYSAARRTSEIGVRIALGASPAGVLGLILREAGLMAGVGIAVGLAGAIALGRFVESQLFGVKAADPLVFAGAALLLALIAVFAALVPGWRASRTDPIAALKYD